MDLTNLEPTKEPVFVQLRHPDTGDLLFDPETKEPVGYDIVSQYSEAFREHERAALDDTLDSAQKNRGKVKTSAVKIEERRMRALISCVSRFQHIELDGKPVVYSAETARDLFTRLPWVPVQVDEEIANIRNFTKALPKK